MKKTLLILTTITTAASVGISLYLGTLSNPTNIQKQLGNTTNTIAVAGATAMFGLLNDQDEDN